MRESTLRKLSETQGQVTLEPDEVAEVREDYLLFRKCYARAMCDCFKGSAEPIEHEVGCRYRVWAALRGDL